MTRNLMTEHQARVADRVLDEAWLLDVRRARL
jgi:hypothetical protein